MKSMFLAVSLSLLFFTEAGAQAAPHASEHAWAMREILADIQEMAGKPVSVSEAQVWSMLPWNPADSLVAFASAQLGSHRAAADAVADQFPRLTQAGTAQLFALSRDVSTALKSNMRSPQAHEAAAIVLGAFALRESAGRFSDPRWAMNRMTAHLAVAAALRGTSPMSVDGELARATLAALVDRQAVALDIIARLGDATDSSPRAAWQRALLMRTRQDWRILKTPAAATRLEKLEYFRARRATLGSRRAGVELEALNEPADAADFARITHLTPVSVDDGNQFVADSVVRELSELAQLHQLVFERPLPKELTDTINRRAERLLSNGMPAVLPWGAWAEFSQRHLAMAIADTDHHYRRMLGLPDEADELKEAIDRGVRHFRMFSLAAISRSDDRPDPSYLRDAIALSVSTPEVITFALWRVLESAAAKADQSSRVASRQKWFMSAPSDVPFDAGSRLGAEYLPLAVLHGLVSAAPHSSWLLWRVDEWKDAPADLRSRTDALLRERAAFDLRALDREVARSNSRSDWEQHLRRGCELSPDRCVRLAERLVPLDEHAAAIAYQRAFDDPALDRVTAAHNSEWLVFFYERTNEPQRARALAETSAKVGSARGMQTYARLLERRGEIEAASKLFEAIAERYPSRTTMLAGFLYRRAVGHGDARFTRRWEEVSRKTFPNGLVPETQSAARPVAGVAVERDRPSSERVRLQVGDIVDGVDGWRVDNLEQFEMVLAFNDQLNTHKVTAWRGVLFSVGVPATHGLTLQTYPNNPWAQ